VFKIINLHLGSNAKVKCKKAERNVAITLAQTTEKAGLKKELFKRE